MVDDKEPQLPTSGDELLPCAILIDREGDWYYQGNRMQRADIVSHLCQHMRRDESSGLYIIQMGKQRCYLEVEDAPLVITGASLTKQGERGSDEQMHLTIKYLDKGESLNPETLWVGEENVLYCRVTEKKIPARFLRPAYYQLAAFIHEDPERQRFYLLVGSKRYYISQER